MKQFKLTLKRPDNSDEFLELSKKIMKHLYKDFGLTDEPDECNRTLEDYLSDINRTLKDLSLKVLGSDWPSVVKALEGLKLVGDQYGVSDDFCPNCGHPDYYYTGGRMLCPQCEYSEEAEQPFRDGDMADYSGRVVL